MAFIKIKNVAIKGLAACVPPNIESNADYNMDKGELAKLIATTGIESRRICDKDTCTSDLCYKAAKTLIEELHWDKEDIDCLIFVTQTPDYILPATSCILQERLGLSKSCYTLDISLGCSGYVYGMSTITSLLATGSFKKGLLLVGDTLSKLCAIKDKSSRPLFGDAGTATALEYDETASDMFFNMCTDGKGKNTIIINDGGYRNMFDQDSLTSKMISSGITRNNTNLALDGMDVFSFAVSEVPPNIRELEAFFDIQKSDYYVFHQANLLMNEMIRKKLKLTKEEVPYSLKDFGNTSCATIPLTMVTELQTKLETEQLKITGSGFGVGLSWGSIYFETNKIVCLPLINY